LKFFGFLETELSDVSNDFLSKANSACQPVSDPTEVSFWHVFVKWITSRLVHAVCIIHGCEKMFRKKSDTDGREIPVRRKPVPWSLARPGECSGAERRLTASETGCYPESPNSDSLTLSPQRLTVHAFSALSQCMP